MPRKINIFGILSALFSSFALANNQLLYVENQPKGYIGKPLELRIIYDTTNQENQLSGIGFRLHYDSNILSFEGIQEIIDKDIIVNAQGPYEDLEDFDSNPATDLFISFGWASLFNDWPNLELPSLLMSALFNVNNQINTDTIKNTPINFSSISSPAGYSIQATNFELEVAKASWDLDGNGHADALTDGLLMLRHNFQIRGDDLVNGAVAVNSPLTTQEIEQSIENAYDIVDIDDDGRVDALTDGLILLRHLFGLAGDALTVGVISDTSNRSTNIEIEQYLEQFMPNETTTISPPLVENDGNQQSSQNLIFTEAFGGAGISDDAVEFIFPSAAESWAGYANSNLEAYPIDLSSGGQLKIYASVPSNDSVDIEFRFEFDVYPITEPSFFTDVITISGSQQNEYIIDLPQIDTQTFSSIILYLLERNVAIQIDEIILSVADMIDNQPNENQDNLDSNHESHGQFSQDIVSFGSVEAWNVDGVIEMVKYDSAEFWGGIAITLEDFVFNLEGENSLLTLDFYSDMPGSLLVAFEDPFDFSQRIEAAVTYSGEGWQTLSIDFAEIYQSQNHNLSSASPLNRLILMPDFGQSGISADYMVKEILFNETTLSLSSQL